MAEREALFHSLRDDLALVNQIPLYYIDHENAAPDGEFTLDQHQAFGRITDALPKLLDLAQAALNYRLVVISSDMDDDIERTVTEELDEAINGLEVGSLAPARLSKPSDVPEAQAIISRLCQLQADVVRVIDPHADRPADCFCGESGFWPIRPGHYRNACEAIDFIEDAAREKLKAVAGMRTPLRVPSPRVPHDESGRA